MPKINNPNYAGFLNSGDIRFITLSMLRMALDNVDGIRGKYIKEGRALLILLYYTGCRPVEALMLKGENIELDGAMLKLRVPTMKKGRTRTLRIPMHKRALVKEFKDYAFSNPPFVYLFPHYTSNYIKIIKNHKGDNITYHENTTKVRHYVKKWFEGVIPDSITPYYLRHNIFSMMSDEGATMDDIMFFKGSRSTQSVEPYLHMNRRRGVKTGKMLPMDKV